MKRRADIAKRFDAVAIDMQKLATGIPTNHLAGFKWTERRSLQLRKSSVSSRRIPLFCKAVRGRRYIHGPGTPVILDKWINTDEYIMLKLKGGLQ